MNELFMNVFIQYSSVLLELKGVKVIRSYREFFQLIRDFLRINDTFRLFYMISLLFARVINLERVAPVGWSLSFWREGHNSSRSSVQKNLVLFIGQRSVIWKKNIENAWQGGEEPPFDLEDLLRRYGSSPPKSEVSTPPSSSAPARNPLEHSAFQRKDGWKPICCCPNF